MDIISLIHGKVTAKLGKFVLIQRRKFEIVCHVNNFTFFLFVKVDKKLGNSSIPHYTQKLYMRHQFFPMSVFTPNYMNLDVK